LQMTVHTITVYCLISLMASTAIIYLGLGTRGIERMLHINQSGIERHHTEISQRQSTGPRIPGGQTIFFMVVGIAYIAVTVWMFRSKHTSKTPYIIAAAGSACIIILYVISRTVDLPYIGLEPEVGTVDVLSKILQVAIIIGSVIMIRQYKEPQEPKLYT